MNLDARLPANLAALSVGVTPQVFNYWRRTGKVTPDEAGTYRYGDVLKAEAAVRRSKKSHRKPRGEWALLNINSAGMTPA